MSRELPGDCGMPDLRICAEPAREMAEALTRLLHEIQEPAIAVSGGSTPRRLFSLLAGEFRQAVDWGRVRLFQVDERCVPPDHAESNWRMLYESLLAHVPEISAFRIEAERPGAAEEYEALIRKRVAPGAGGVPRFDVVLLGMGIDGHTASLFPGTAALEERDRLVVLNEAPQLGTTRATMTFPLLEAAARRWFLVTGREKSRAFSRVQRGELPAGRLDAKWFVSPDVTS